MLLQVMLHLSERSIIHVAVGATFHVKTNTALVTNVLGVF